MKKYRNEWKYHISEPQMVALVNKLDAVLERDNNGIDGCYFVKSLYFDDYRDSCLKANEAGLADRFKYRIRYYGEDASYLKLERKEKKNALCRKYSSRITLEQYKKIVNGDVCDIVCSTDDSLLKLFCVDILKRRFEPKVVIEYERQAYIEPVANIRITIDKNVAASDEYENFLEGDYFRYPVMNKGVYVLEVKFDDIMPSYVKEAIESGVVIQTANSKYALGRAALFCRI